MSAIKTRNITRTFGTFTAVDGVDLNVEPGEIVGLLGANGAGKTTLIKLILGLLLPSSGNVHLFDEMLSLEQRRRIGYVPQNLGLYSDLTVEQNLEFRASIFGVKRDEDAPNTELVRAQPLGMQRRTAFAAATQHEPELLILDEPTSGVSPLERSRLWDMIHRQAEAGTAVLVSTHYMDEAEQADRLVIMSHGSVVATGTAEQIIDEREIVEVVTKRWAEAFDALDQKGRAISLAGRAVRVLNESTSTVRDELTSIGIEAEVSSVPATLDEVLIELDSRNLGVTNSRAT